ncbi:MAG: hypothetical protein ACYTG7_16215 [Planctomycetota bacterium]|jgi:hypothetical protein
MKKILVIIFLLGWPALALPAKEVLVFADPVLVKGEAHVLSLTVDVPEEVFLSVIYRPNSATEMKEDPAPFSEEGMITWTPQAAGIATLTVLDGAGETITSEDVSICYSGIPASGILTMILAGVLLFGGAAFSLTMALRRLPSDL